MKSFVSALSFLTIVPTGQWAGKLQGAALLYFPVIGILIGGLLTGVDWLGSLFLFDPLRALVDVAFLALITGALHLDGLADTADGLYFHHDREKSLQAMKDSRTGVMGVLALLFGLGFKFVGLLALEFQICWIWFLIAPALGRSAQVVGLVFMGDAREEGGVGRALYQQGKYHYLIFGLIPLALPFIISISVGLTVLFAFLFINMTLLKYFRHRLGGMTGDTFGALTEIMETFFLVFGGWVCKGIV